MADAVSSFGGPDIPSDQADAVLQFLMAVNLADCEAEFRGVLDNISTSPDRVELRDLTIATVGVLMSMAGVPWPVIMRVVTHLARLSDEQLKEGAVAIVNGAYLILPDGDDRAIQLDMTTLRQVDDIGHAFVSAIYSCTAVWERAVQIFSGN